MAAVGFLRETAEYQHTVGAAEAPAGEVAGGAWRGVSGILARIMHGAVRVFGGLYHRLALLLALCALCAALVGCAGCAIPGGFTPGDTPPPYTVEEVR